MTDIRTPIGNLRPYHVYPLIVYLRDHYREMDDETRRALMAHVAMHSPDPAAVAALADIHEDAWGSLYPREDTVTPGTTDTIDKFIATYGHPRPKTMRCSNASYSIPRRITAQSWPMKTPRAKRRHPAPQTPPQPE